MWFFKKSALEALLQHFFCVISFLGCQQGSADSNYSQPSSDISIDEEKEALQRETERQALSQLEKAKVRYREYWCGIFSANFVKP